MNKLSVIFLTMILSSIILVAEDYPLRIYHCGDGQDHRITNFKILCERAKIAGYTHITYAVDVRAGSSGDSTATSEWRNGVYARPDTGQMIEDTKDHFVAAYDEGLRLIPILPAANTWGGKQWAFANNDSITYQPIIREDLDEKVMENISTDVRVLAILNRFFDYYGNSPGYHISVSDVPSYTEQSGGLAKTYTSLLEDVIQVAFEQFKVLRPDTVYTEIDYIHMANDEVLEYDPLLQKKMKLLIGKSQEDLKWLYDYDSLTHCNIGRLERTHVIVDDMIISKHVIDSLQVVSLGDTSSTVLDTNALLDYWCNHNS